MSRMKYDSPSCLGASGLVRASSMPQLERWATVVHTFWPFTIQSSPSRTARVARPATSEPALGSLNIWHQISSPEKIFGKQTLLLLLAGVGEHHGRAHADADDARGRIAVHDLRVARDLVVHDQVHLRRQPEPAVAFRESAPRRARARTARGGTRCCRCVRGGSPRAARACARAARPRSSCGIRPTGVASGRAARVRRGVAGPRARAHHTPAPIPALAAGSR